MANGRYGRFGMTKPISLFVAILAGVSALSMVSAAEILDSDVSDGYFYTERVEILIHEPANVVWPHLVDLDSWMYQFDMTHESGPPGEVGETRRLYAGEEYFIEIVSLIPEQVLVFLNLPSDAGGESMTGTTMVTLSETAEGTLVSLSTSREYRWLGDGPDSRRATRETAEFQANSQAGLKRFMTRLRDLAEGRAIQDQASP